MDKIDFSYMRFPEGSIGNVIGRRLQAHELAKRMMLADGIIYNVNTHRVTDDYYFKAYWEIAIREAEMLHGED